jgi:hypothetical protein
MQYHEKKMKKKMTGGTSQAHIPGMFNVFDDGEEKAAVTMT